MGKVKSENEKIMIILVTTIFVLVIMYVALSISNIKSGYELVELQIQKQKLEIKNDELESIIEKLPILKIKVETETETEIFEAVIYGYNSEKNQTDDTPNITASGQKTRDGIVANNCLAFGTKVKIDNRIYEVQDRMNSKYGCEVFDIWFAEKQDAIDWGKQNKIITIQ